MKISELPLAQTVGEDDVTVIVQDGTTKKAAVNVLTENVLQTADTNAQGYAETAEANAVKAANAAALAAQQAAEETAQGYANTAEANAKDAAPSDLLLTNGLLQLVVGGEAIGKGVQLPQETMELWNDITLNEDVDTIEITQTDAAAPINLKRAFIIFMGQFSAANPSVRVRANGGQIYQAYSTVTAPADTDCTWWITIDKLAPGIFSSTYITTAITNNAATPSNPNLQGLSTAIQPTARDIAFRGLQSADAYLHIRSLLVSLGSGQTIRAGSRILVFGAQDNS